MSTEMCQLISSLKLTILATFSISILIQTLVVESVTNYGGHHGYQACKPRNCGVGPNISYPFQIEDDNINFCGYPGYKVKCINHAPFFQVDQITYAIKDIFYEYQSSFMINSTVIFRLGKNRTLDIKEVEFFRHGYLLEWSLKISCSNCQRSGGYCGFNNNKTVCFCVDGEHQKHCKDGRRNLKLLLCRVIAGIFAAGIWISIILVFCFKRNRALKSCMFICEGETMNHQSVQKFLDKCGCLAPRRYCYSEVKKMTNSFKVKLGQGGYGCVYKGQLCEGSVVAVKVLYESKGNGQEFLNEVASISKTSHVNIVTLLGFCYEGNKRCLIYEFMPNGSLEKFIYDRSSLTRQLGWENLFQIAVGIARGLEYLHRGCNTQILHFDIKPHNILLDKDFLPKVSDFGLAKLCLRNDCIISTLTARGTIGYIAPEVFNRNFGKVSPKSDVYSYGMMVLEMAGGRKNFEVEIDHPSEINFPQWIHNRLELNEELELPGIMNEDENENARKMVTVGLWCIQIDPSSQPSMTRVVEMLEGELLTLQIPPKPFLSPPPRSAVEI